MVAVPAPKKAGAKKGAGKTVAKKAENTKKDNKKKEKESKTDDKLLPEDVVIDEEATHEGTVSKYFSKRGFGFVKFNGDSPVEGYDEVMVHWKEIKSDDRWPSLTQDMTVEFKLGKQKKGNGKVALQARSLTLPGGVAVCIQDSRDDDKEFLGGDKNLRYTGNIVWFDQQKGFGYVKLEEGYDIPDEVPEEIVISREEVHCGTENEVPRLPKNLDVEFGIFKGDKGTYRVFNLTLPGGDPVTRTLLEDRQLVGDDIYNGTVKIAKGGMAWIECTDAENLPADFKTKLNEMAEERKKKAEERKKKDEEAGDFQALIYFRKQDAQDDHHYWEPGHNCTFKIYTDKKGCGACDVAFCP